MLVHGNAFGALAADGASPAFTLLRRGEAAGLQGRGPQNVQVVDLPQNILQLFQVFAPVLIVQGQKVLDDVAESLDANAKRMQRDFASIAKGGSMQPDYVLELFQGDHLEDIRTNRKLPLPRIQCVCPAQPGASIEARQRCGCLCLQLPFAGVTIRAQAVLDGIVCPAQLFYPLLQHLNVAQLSQGGEERFAGFAHPPPGGIGIDGAKPFRHGAATPQGNPQVVHRGGGEPGLDALALCNHAFHPVADAALFLRACGSCCHDYRTV